MSARGRLALPAAFACALGSLGTFAMPSSRKMLLLALPLALAALVLAVVEQRRSPSSAWAAGALLIGLIVVGVELASMLLARV